MYCTSIVNEQIQPGLRFQESFAEATDGLQTGQVQRHVEHISTSCFLEQDHYSLKTMMDNHFVVVVIVLVFILQLLLLLHRKKHFSDYISIYTSTESSPPAQIII